MKLNEEGLHLLVPQSYLSFSSKMFRQYFSEDLNESQWLNALLFVDLMELIDLLYLMKLSFLNLEPLFVYHLKCLAQSLIHFSRLLQLIF
jgi:hypothetical protein